MQPQNGNPFEQIDAWILGSGTASLASALYLIKYSKIPPAQVHLLESRDSVQEVLHHTGDPHGGYDQIAGCLPLPIGGPLKELLASIPASNPARSGSRQSYLGEIETNKRRGPPKKVTQTNFLVQKNRLLQKIATAPLDLQWKHRMRLAQLVLRPEPKLGRNQIKDFFHETFFETTFWAIWSAQFGLQPWHSVAEFRRALFQYLGDLHRLSILDCLDITGRYQYESIYLPIYRYLQGLEVDFQFDTTIKEIVTTDASDRRVSRLELVQNGFPLSINLGPQDIVIANLGSTISGTAVGSNEKQPYASSYESLDENWALWLDLCSKAKSLGNPYCFCCRRFESMMESFTITTEDLSFFNRLISLSSPPSSSSTAGTIIILRESRWKLNLCLPTQPVFQDQPHSVRVLWGFALLPELPGDYIKKPMVQCSGADITAELMRHLNLSPRTIFQRTVTIPRVMPRMSSLLLAHSGDERPKPIVPEITNLGLVGEFVEIPQYSCIDMSYGLRAAKTVVSRLTGVKIPNSERKRSRIRLLLQIVLWK